MKRGLSDLLQQRWTVLYSLVGWGVRCSSQQDSEEAQENQAGPRKGVIAGHEVSQGTAGFWSSSQGRDGKNCLGQGLVLYSLLDLPSPWRSSLSPVRKGFSICSNIICRKLKVYTVDGPSYKALNPWWHQAGPKATLPRVLQGGVGA